MKSAKFLPTVRLRQIAMAVGFASLLGFSGPLRAAAQDPVAKGPGAANPSIVEPLPSNDPAAVTLQDMQRASIVQGIPMDEIRLSMSHSKPIVDTITEFRKNPSFGDIWVTYKPYKVHLRLATDSPEIENSLAQVLGFPFETTVRGLSSSELSTLSVQLAEKLKDSGTFTIIFDQIEGQLVVKTSSPTATRIAGSRFVRVVSEVVEPVPTVTAYGGLPLYVYTGSVNGWFGYCTGGFMMRNSATSASGILTAGHCPDYTQQQWYNAETPSSASFNRTCGGANGDGKILQLTGTSNSTVFTNSQASQYVTNIGMGGYFIGQQVRQGRLGLNGNPGGNVGTITSYQANLPVGGTGAACPQLYTLSNAFTVNVQSTPGDSGGPLLASYNNGWYGLAITTASAAGSGVSSFSPWWTLNVAGWNFCSSQSC